MLRHVLVATSRVITALHVVSVDKVINTLLDCPTISLEPGRQLFHHLTDQFLVCQLLLGLHDADDGGLDQVPPLLVNTPVCRLLLTPLGRPQRNVDVDSSLLVLVVLVEMADGVQRQRQLRVLVCVGRMVAEQQTNLQQSLEYLLQVGDADLSILLQLLNRETGLTVVLQQHGHLHTARD